MTEKDTLELEHQISASDEIKKLLEDSSDNIPEMSVSEYLTQLLEEHDLEKASVIANSNIDRSYAYHIFSGDKKQPSRTKVLALAVAMGLSPKETQMLLYYAKQNMLYVKNAWDKIIWFALEKKLTVQQTNDTLGDLSMEPLLK